VSSGHRWWRGGAVVAVLLVAAVGVLVTRPGPSRAPHAAHIVPVAPAPVSHGLDPALAAPSGQAFGVNVNLLFNDFAYAPAQIDAQLAAVRATGATLARSDALWEATEPRAPIDGRHSYDWAFDDQIAGALAATGLTWLPILDYTAPWAQSIPGQDHSPPRSDADYAAYAAAFTARYGARGVYWQSHPALTPVPVTTIEIWNEPDNGEFWTPAPDAGRYGDLYLAARAAIDVVNPSIRVIIGGLTAPATFVPAMLRAVPELRGHVDGVAIHPYGSPAVVASKIRGARAALASDGMAAVPLYVTEFGWTTEPPGALNYASAPRRPGYIAATLADLRHLDCGLAASLLYTWVSPRRDRADAQDWYGIADPDDAAAVTADTEALSAGLRAAAAPRSVPPAPCAD
jgi:hypothetical protein